MSLQFCEKKRRRVFAFFKNIFLRNRSLSNAKWFYHKKRKIWRKNLYLAENRLSRNEMWCAAANHNYKSRVCAKKKKKKKKKIRFEFLLSSYWQNIKFSKNCPNLRGGTETNRQCFADIWKSRQSQFGSKSRIYCRIDALKTINTVQRHLDNKHRQLILPICTRFIANWFCRLLQISAKRCRLVYVPPLTYSQKSYFCGYNCNFLHQLLLPYQFYGRNM